MQINPNLKYPKGHAPKGDTFEVKVKMPDDFEENGKLPIDYYTVKKYYSNVLKVDNKELSKTIENLISKANGGKETKNLESL